MILPGWGVLANIQLRIAERWLERGVQSGDHFAQFFFYFAGVNALYYLWSKADGVRGGTPGRPPNEAQQIEHLLSKAGASESVAVLAAARDCVAYFSDRRPIERMDKRSARHATAGSGREGSDAREILLNEGDNERLRALGHILYLVRSNLVHGSKMDCGDDQEVIEHAAPGLRSILEWAVRYTRSELGGA